MKQLWFFPANREHNAPSGAILYSTENDRETAVAGLLCVDIHGMICDDDEADRLAAEVCRRWNAANEQPAPK